jgi:hypothetical protein
VVACGTTYITREIGYLVAALYIEREIGLHLFLNHFGG